MTSRTGSSASESFWFNLACSQYDAGLYEAAEQNVQRALQLFGDSASTSEIKAMLGLLDDARTRLSARKRRVGSNAEHRSVGSALSAAGSVRSFDPAGDREEPVSG